MYWPNLLGSPKPSKMANSFAAIEVVHQCIAMFAQFPATDRLIRPNQDAATNDLTDFFLAAASKEPPTLVVLLRARFRAPLPLPPEWRDTHASQQTNSQLLRNQKSRLASPNLWWVRCIGWRERVCTKLIEAGMPAAASSLLQLTKLASRAATKPYQSKTIVYYTKSYQAMVWNNSVNTIT